MRLEEVFSLIDIIEENCYVGDNENAMNAISNLINEFEGTWMDNTEFVFALNLIAKALEKKDYSLVADYLEFALKPVLSGSSIPECLYDTDYGDIPMADEQLYYSASCTDELVLYGKKDDGQAVRFNSRISPEHEVEMVLSSLKLKKTTPVVCLFGIGTGLLAKRLLETLSIDAKLIVYEPDEKIIEYCLECSDSPGCDNAERVIGERLKSIIDDRRVLFYYSNREEFSFVNYLCGELNFRSLYGLIFYVNRGYESYYPKKCLDFIRSIDTFRRFTLTNLGTSFDQRECYIERIFSNLSVYKKINLADDLGKILPKDIPVVLVSAGPSLKKNAELLRMVKGHFFIVAVDTAVQYLMTRDIIPDITITIDPKKPESCYQDDRSHSIPCIVSMNSNSKIIDKLHGRMFILTNNEYVNGLLKTLDKDLPIDLMGGGSVATDAFALLCNLRQKKIVLIGQDLASTDGKTHAIDTNIGELGEIQVEGIDGDMVFTRNDWLVFLKWYEIFIDNQKKINEDLRVIDATEGGAKIHGTEIMTFKEAIDDCRDEFGNLPCYEFDKELKKLDYYLGEEDYRQLCRKHRDNVSKLRLLIIKAEEAARTCEKLISGIESGTMLTSYIEKEKKKMLGIHNDYKNNPMYSLIDQELNGSIIAEISSLSLRECDGKDKELNEFMILKLFFDNVADVANKIIDNAKKYDGLL